MLPQQHQPTSAIIKTVHQALVRWAGNVALMGKIRMNMKF
jgi:hypothetical protein